MTCAGRRSRGSVPSARCVHVGQSRLWWSLGLLSGSGGAARADSHGPKPHASTTISVWFKRSARLWFTTRTLGSTAAVARRRGEGAHRRAEPAESAAGVKSSVPADEPPARHLDRLRRGDARPEPRLRSSRRPEGASACGWRSSRSPPRSSPTVHAVQAPRSPDTPSPASRASPCRIRCAAPSFARLLPAIVVHSPSIDAVSRPHGARDRYVERVRGGDGGQGPERRRPPDRAEVLHGQLRHRLPRPLSATISYHVATAQNGTIVVTDTSARGGRPPNIVRIPVKLSP